MSLSNEFNKLNLAATNEVEVAKSPRGEIASGAVGLVAGEGRAPQLDQQAPSVAEAKEELPKEFRKIAKLIGVDQMVLVGSGTFGNVFLATNSAKPNEKFALKVVDINDAQPKHILEQEARIMAGVSGKPGFLDFHGNGFIKASRHRNTPARFVFKMEFVPFSVYDLAVKFDETGFKPSLMMLRRLFKNLVDACTFLHSKSIAHHDIKSENVMVQTPSGRGLDGIEDLDSGLRGSTFKLIDFGCVEHVGGGYQELAKSRHQAGTKEFMSMDKFYSCYIDSRWYNPYVADGFAVGCTLYCVADPRGYIEMQKQKNSDTWVPVWPHLRQSHLKGKLGQLRTSYLLPILETLLDDHSQVLLSKIEDDSY